jgi:hypothetical protein
MKITRRALLLLFVGLFIRPKRIVYLDTENHGRLFKHQKDLMYAAAYGYKTKHYPWMRTIYLDAPTAACPIQWN